MVASNQRTKVTASRERDVVVTREFDAPRDLVFEATPARRELRP